MNRELTPCPPWLFASAAPLLGAAEQGRLHHALLITGVDGIGKQAFCQWLAEALLCEERTELGACGNCAACAQLQAQAHPDFHEVLPEGANAGIKIDRVRELVEWMQLTAGQGSYRVALISNANGFNNASSNSLLKTLEEPADNAVLILGATRAGALSATVRSRCQKITLKIDDRQAAINWLSERVSDPEQALLESAGGPYAAVRLETEEHRTAKALLLKAWNDLFLHKGSVGRIADSLSQLDATQCLVAFSRWCVLAAKHSVGASVKADAAVTLAIAETHNILPAEHWFKLHDTLLQLHRTHSASFKTQTVLEGLFADIRLQIAATTGG